MNMTMAEATELAMEIMQDRRVMVVAIGRFRLLEELVRDGAEELPWGVFGCGSDNPGQRATVWSHELWRDFRDLLPESTRKVRPTKQAPVTPSVPVSETEQQFMLF